MPVKLICLLFSWMAMSNTSLIAQTKLTGNRYAYCKFSLPGNIPAIGNGEKQVSIIQERFIYVETRGTAKPVISSIVSGKFRFSHTIRLIDQFPEIPGKIDSNGAEAIINRHRGYSLWRLDMVPGSDEVVIPPVELNGYTLTGSLQGKPFRIYINKETRLTAEPRY